MFEFYTIVKGRGGDTRMSPEKARAALGKLANITHFTDKRGPGVKAPSDGWGPLPGSVAGGMTKMGNFWWPSSGAAKKDAKVFKAKGQEHQRIAKAAKKAGDSDRYDTEMEMLNYCYTAGTAAWKQAKPEYFQYSDREKVMQAAERKGRKLPPRRGGEASYR